MYFDKLLALAAVIAAPAAALAPLHEVHGSTATSIPGKYIVRLKETISAATAHDVKSLMDEVDHVYNVTSFQGLAGRLNYAALQSVRAHPGVDYVERDALLPASNYVSQHGAPWGLGRISHSGQGHFTDNTTYVYEESAGEGVCAYVLDSGIRLDHEEFEGRAEFLENFTAGGGNETDAGVHGTHVAGIIGGATYGVAKKVKLYSVKVLNDNGIGTGVGTSEIKSSMAVLSSCLQGMAFVADDSQTRHCPNGTVANLSWGGWLSHALNDLAEDLLNRGVFVVVAAGNFGISASRVSPASEPNICTVGATAKSNSLAYFSNHGPIVDILAPGVDILSASNRSTTASTLMSGTSMAAPHVAGLAACLLASEHRDPKTLCEYMAKMASPVITQLRNNTVDLIAFNGNPKG